MANLSRQLRPASFRGVSIAIESDDTGSGRRIVTHEFPGSDEPSHEDLGASVRKFSVKMVVLGRDYLAKAKALESALGMPGPASFIHPHFGELTVLVKDVTRSHSSNAIGEVQFSVSMERYGVPQYPTAAGNTATGLLSAADSSFDSIISDFVSHFTVASVPDFITTDAILRNGSFIDGLKSILGSAGITQAFPVLNVLSSDFVQMAVGIYETLMAAVAPKRKPVIGSVSTSTIPSAPRMVRALMNAADQRLTDTDAVTSTSMSIRAQNAQSLDFLHRLSSLSAGVGSVRHVSFESREDALAIRDGLSNRLGDLRDELGAAGWDRSWQASADLQAALNRDISERIGRLPRTVQIRPASVRSSLALANRLYGDQPEALVQRAGDIVRRNAIRHPGFVPAEVMEVLIDAS